MTELALHILDIANNSTRAKATEIKISVVADSREGEQIHVGIASGNKTFAVDTDAVAEAIGYQHAPVAVEYAAAGGGHCLSGHNGIHGLIVVIVAVYDL